MSEQTADPLTIYCPACDESFLGRLGEALCPRCGTPGTSSSAASLHTIVYTDDSLHSGPIAANQRTDLTPLIGTEIDHYHIESQLGKGGMGWVFLAHHLTLNRLCALKILEPALIQTDPGFVERFRTEGQSAAALSDPHVVTVHTIGEADGYHFLEMEFVPGRSLAKVIQDRPLNPIRALTLANGIASGLVVAHSKGIVHRDLKPDNVLLTHQGRPKIADFGLAKRLHGTTRQNAGALFGTPSFMAPELFHFQEATPASDVYALGVSLFQMLTGRVPFHGDNINAISHAVRNEPFPDIREIVPEVSLELSECIAQMVEKSPGNRPRNAIAAGLLLQAVLGQSRDLETLLIDAFAHEPQVKWRRGEGNRYCADVTLPDQRRQAVFLETSPHGISDRLLQIYSLCCPAVDHFHAEALRLNSTMPHGAIALREVDGQEYFVTLNNYPLATVDAEEIRRSVIESATRADAIESHLTGEDCH